MQEMLRAPWRVESTDRWPGLFDVYDRDGNVVAAAKVEEVAHLIAAAPALKTAVDEIIEIFAAAGAAHLSSFSKGEINGRIGMRKDATYFVILADDDGDFYFTLETEDDLLKRLNPDEYGDAELEAATVLDVIPDMTAMKHWPSGFVLIIRGEIVVPKPVEVVTRFEV